MSVLCAGLILAAISFVAGGTGGLLAIWSLRRSILDDIRAEKAGDLAE